MPGTMPAMVGRRRAVARSGSACEQRRRVGVVRIGEQAAHALLLDLLAGILHDHALRRLGDHAHVVGDQDQRHAALALQGEQQVEDLRLDGDVERGGRLVGDQQAADCRRSPWRSSPAGSCRRTAGAGRRAAAARARGCRPGRAARCARRRRSARLPPSCTCSASVDLEADREAGIEAGHRLLEDHRHVLADDPAPVAGRQPQQVGAGERQAVGRDPGGPGQQPHDRQHRHALARAGLADDRQHLAGVDRRGRRPSTARNGPRRGRELDR